MPPVNPRVVTPPADGVWRVARGPDPLHARRADPDTLTSSKSGNRFDSPDSSYGVLYFGTDLRGCFGEVLSRKRPDQALARLVEEDWRDHHFMEVGSVPREWRDRRSDVRVRLRTDRYAYLDVEHPETLEFLRGQLALGLASLGLDDLNLGTVRGPDRRVTRLISSWAWTAADDQGNPMYNGIRYVSKLDNDWECWAVFEDAEMDVADTKPITLDMPELIEVANRYSLRMY